MVSAVVSYYESLPNEGEADRQVENEEAPTENEEPPTENKEPPTENEEPPTENEEAPTENEEPPTDDWQMFTNMIVENTTKQSRSQSLNEEKADTGHRYIAF